MANRNRQQRLNKAGKKPEQRLFPLQGNLLISPCLKAGALRRNWEDECMKELCPTDNQPHNFIPVDGGYFRSGQAKYTKTGMSITRVKVVTMCCTKCLKRGTIETRNVHKTP
jgi:hypothetical protein